MTLQFQQPIAANEAAEGGPYTKTLTFTLSTTYAVSVDGAAAALTAAATPPRHLHRPSPGRLVSGPGTASLTSG